MQKWPMANNIFQCDFLLQPLLHRLHLVILAFLSREVLYGKNFNRSSRKGLSLDFFVFSCFRYPRYQRIIGHMPNTRDIFCLQLRLYGPVNYFCSCVGLGVALKTEENNSRNSTLFLLFSKLAVRKIFPCVSYLFSRFTRLETRVSRKR